MIISFTKNNIESSNSTHWYLLERTWRGEYEDLQAPISLNNLIEEITSIGVTNVSFEVSEFYVEGYDCLHKVLNEEMENGRYESEHGEIYICDLLFLYFPNGYPNKIYYRLKDES